MTSQPPSYRGYRFPSEIISHAVWLYYRFGLSFRDVEDLLAERGITVTYEAIRLWCRTFGLNYARRLRRRRGRQGDTWYLDELFVKIQGQQQYLWRAADEDGDVLDILVQSRRNRRAATRFFRKLLKRQGREPRRLITDKLRSYSAAHRTVMPSVIHSTQQYENNRAEVSHQSTRQRERQMRRFRSAAHLQRFASVHGVVQNLGLSGFPNAETLNMTRSYADDGLIGQPRLEENGPCVARRRRGVVSDQARLRTGVDP